MYDVNHNNPFGLILTAANKIRRCIYFIPYSKGFYYTDDNMI